MDWASAEAAVYYISNVTAHPLSASVVLVLKYSYLSEFLRSTNYSKYTNQLKLSNELKVLMFWRLFIPITVNTCSFKLCITHVLYIVNNIN